MNELVNSRERFMSVNVDNLNFQIVRNSEYVDKSVIIALVNQVIDTEERFICVTRPRRFGKSVTVKMLNAYYSKGCDSKALFSDLNIASKPDFEKHLNQHDVIYLDMTEFADNEENGNKYLENLNTGTVSELKDTYPECFDKEKNYSLPEAIRCLKKRFIFIIDEWDFVFREYPNNSTLQKNFIDLLRALFKGVGERFVELVYMTGILPIARYNTQSALNNFIEYTILKSSNFSQFYGFTENEVKALCEKYNLDFETTKFWYDGYKVGGYEIYNPNSIKKLITRREFQSYWSYTSAYDLVKEAINLNFEGLKDDIIKLCSGTSIRIYDIESFNTAEKNFPTKDSIYVYLVHLGYLGYNDEDSTIYVPNEETRRELLHSVRDNHWPQYESALKLSEQVVVATYDKDTDTVANLLSKIHEDKVPALEYNNESALRYVVLMSYLATEKDYLAPINEFPTGKGFADIVYLPINVNSKSKPALIIEIKKDANAKVALEQIKERDYVSRVKEHTDNILLIGINYDSKTKQHTCSIEEYQK
ncbi:MAG: ATP-binding protein [Succinatimonas sp.]|nr:ATP-binding protein [Succinatimonas sp.]